MEDRISYRVSKGGVNVKYHKHTMPSDGSKNFTKNIYDQQDSKTHRHEQRNCARCGRRGHNRRGRER